MEEIGGNMQSGRTFFLKAACFDFLSPLACSGTSCKHKTDIQYYHLIKLLRQMC